MSRRFAGTSAALLVTALLAAVVAGCGSDEKSATEKWADGLCSSLVRWRDSLKSASDKVTGGNISLSNIQSAASEASAANAKLQDDLGALGKPPSNGSKEAKATASQLADDLRNSVGQIKDTVAGVSSTQEALSAASVVTATVATMKEDVSSAVDRLRTLGGEGDSWKDAFAGSKACQDLSSG
jgi:hypothetical protein